MIHLRTPRIILGLITLAALAASPVQADTRVGGYSTKRGTYVAPHYKSSPDSSRSNNYSSKGNFNPYTGKLGNVDPFKTPRIR